MQHVQYEKVRDFSHMKEFEVELSNALHFYVEKDRFMCHDYMACRIVKIMDNGRPFLFQFGAKYLSKFCKAMSSIMDQRVDWGKKDLLFNVGGNFTISIVEERSKRGGRRVVFSLNRPSKKLTGKMTHFTIREDEIEPLYDALYHIVQENELEDEEDKKSA